MSHHQTVSESAIQQPDFKIRCDLVVGSLRCVARLGTAPDPVKVQAVWLAETGTAQVTEQTTKR